MPNHNTLNIFKFNADLRKFAEKVGKDLGDQVADTATELFVKIVERTPVDTGLARSNWTISLSAPDLTTNTPGSYPEYKEDPTSRALGKANEVLDEIRRGELKTIYLANATPYIGALEDGSSDYAPAGMVSLTIDEVEGNIKA